MNCGSEDPSAVAGDCNTGTSAGFYNWTMHHGLPDESCQEYDGIDHECSALRTCMNCQKDYAADDITWTSDCYPVQHYAKYFVSEWGSMDSPSVHEMKSEIHSRGPITCQIASSYLEDGLYTPGTIVSVSGKKWEFDHEISIVGWGSEDDVEYWIVRNSWGTWWGEEGFFRVEAGVNAIGIETLCDWAVPTEPVVQDWGPLEGNRMFPSTVGTKTDSSPQQLTVDVSPVPSWTVKMFGVGAVAGSLAAAKALSLRHTSASEALLG